MKFKYRKDEKGIWRKIVFQKSIGSFGRKSVACGKIPERIVPHSSVEEGIVNTEKDLVSFCPCGNEMHLYCVPQMGPYQHKVVKEVSFERGGVEICMEETPILRFPICVNLTGDSIKDFRGSYPRGFLYYRCDKCGSVIPFSYTRDELKKITTQIINYYEKYADGSIIQDNFLYELAKRIEGGL